jgi:hypothetical protein
MPEAIRAGPAIALLVLLLASPGLRAAEPASLAATGAYPDFLPEFSDASAAWGGGVEAAIEESFRLCFRTYIVAGKVITLRMPFAQNNERSDLVGGDLAVEGGGKEDPLALWEGIDALLSSDDFRAYVSALSDGREKAIVFDLEARRWSVLLDWFTIGRMKMGAYPGLPHKPYVLARGGGPRAVDVYNYVYCVGRLGMDCSGFVWHVLGALARKGGIDLDRAAGRLVGAPRSSDTPLYIGAAFFDPRNKALEEVKDEIRNLRPADVILFRAEDGSALHSAVIQSVDLEAGLLRYLQSTDEAPQEERGVHESFISFDPERPETSLRDPSVIWSQTRAPTFEGEMASPWRDDGERYRSALGGGGAVVRIKALRTIATLLRSARR